MADKNPGDMSYCPVVNRWMEQLFNYDPFPFDNDDDFQKEPWESGLRIQFVHNLLKALDNKADYVEVPPQFPTWFSHPDNLYTLKEIKEFQDVRS